MKVVDIETTGLDFKRDRILLSGVDKSYYIDGQSFYIPEQVAGHNFKFDCKFLTQAIPADQRDNRWFKAYAFDTMLAASILIDRPEKISLDACAKYWLNIESWKELDRKKMSSYPIEEVASYCLKDVAYTAQLAEVLQAKLREQGSWEFFINKIMPAARLLAEVEYRGMRINVEATTQKLGDINQQIGEVEKDLNARALEGIVTTKFTIQKAKNLGTAKNPRWTVVTKAIDYKPKGDTNWNSPQQVINILKSKGFDILWYDFKRRITIDSSCDEALQPHTSENFIQNILKHRELTKLAGYLEGWLELQYEGRLHATYNMANVRTGRLSCSGPNLQQVPRDKAIRSLFIPSEGKVFVIADYPQIEPRFSAHYSQDISLLNVFKNKEDFYGSIAVNVLGVKCKPNEVKTLFPQMRQVAKEIGLSILYGIGPQKLADIIKRKTGQIFTKAQCQAIINDYFRAYPGLLELRKYVEKKVYEKGVLTNHYGRKIRVNIDDVFAQGVNSLIQSSASDACLFAQLKFANHPHAKLVHVVHDEVVYEISPEHAQAFGKELCEHMSNIGITCPIEMEFAIGKSWGDKK